MNQCHHDVSGIVLLNPRYRCYRSLFLGHSYADSLVLVEFCEVVRDIEDRAELKRLGYLLRILPISFLQFRRPFKFGSIKLVDERVEFARKPF